MTSFTFTDSGCQQSLHSLGAMTSTTEATTLAHRYAHVWNERDEARRREAVADLWAEDGVEYLESAEHRGHESLCDRVASAHEQFVATGGFVFVAADDVVAHHDAVTFSVHMVPAAGGSPVWSGVIFILLDEFGRIRCDYQFTGEEAGTRAAVAEFLSRLADGDPVRIADLFADTVDWQLDWPEEGHPSVPWIRHRSARADVADHFRELNASHVREDRGGMQPLILVDGPDAVVLGDIRQTVRATGRAYRALAALHLTIVNGQIARYHVYEDSLTVAQALARAND